MFSHIDSSHRRIPTLVQYCQRVASIHVDSISGFGDNLRYELIKPVLEHCSVESLARLEEASPHIQEHTPELWKKMCFRSYPLAVEQYRLNEPRSWKDEFFTLRDLEAKRLDELGTRLRMKRLKADGEKKEREVKITEGIFPTKRPSKWSASSQPKTLFQKTRSEASKIQKNMFTLQMIPRMPNGKAYRVLHNTLSAKLPPALPSTTPNRTTVVRVYPDSSASSPSSSSTSSPSQLKLIPPTRPVHATTKKDADALPASRPPNIGKKDPMAALFMPKHRAHSQLPSAPAGKLPGADKAPILRTRLVSLRS